MDKIIFTVALLLSLTLQVKAQNTQGMQLVKGGTVFIGNEQGAKNEKPVFQTYLDDFYLDTKPVTVAEFRRFVKVNRFITDAEKMGYAFVYDSLSKDWQKVEGAYWEYPEGEANGKASAQAAVTQISYYDAAAYANWLGKRLPSEFEIEHAIKSSSEEFSGFGSHIWFWTESLYREYSSEDYYRKTIQEDRSLRGGKLAEAQTFRPSMRKKSAPRYFNNCLSFRCAQEAKP